MHGFLNDPTGLRTRSELPDQGRSLGHLGRRYGVLVPLKLELMLERRRQQRARAKTGGVQRGYIDSMMAVDTRLAGRIRPAEVSRLMSLLNDGAVITNFDRPRRWQLFARRRSR